MFGATDGRTIAIVSAIAGSPTRDDSTDPTKADVRLQHHSYGRRVCWDHIGLCTHFGGDNDSALMFEGWTNEGPTLRAAADLGVGSRANNYPALTHIISTDDLISDGACRTAWVGPVHEIQVHVVSDGDPFVAVTFDDTGSATVVRQQPNPASIFVDFMAAGYWGDGDANQTCEDDLASTPSAPSITS